MKKLTEIIYRLPVIEQVGSTEQYVDKIAFNSKEVSANTLFVAIKGTMSDGHQYIESAILNGANVIVCQEMPTIINEAITFIVVKDAQEALSHIADLFFNQPSQKLKLVGVTGTNGKTTTATLLYQLFTKLGYACGLLSTVKIMVHHDEIEATHTTPDAVKINFYLQEMVNAGCEYCFMEVSSHGIHQKRTQHLHFAGGIFTNLSHDHLDYHESFAAYRDVKKSFFDHLMPSAFAITNADDKNGGYMVQNTKAKIFTYGLNNLADVQIKVMEKQLNGMLLQMDGKEVWVQLIGGFNASNLGAIYLAAKCLGVNESKVLLQMSTLKSVSGRFQYFVSKNNITAIVDYAHTPDALQNVLDTIHDLKANHTQLITVVGCGGDRDKTKRPMMGKIACECSTLAIFTNDNPRNEKPEAILKDMEENMPSELKKKYLKITDRREAIKTACTLAKSGDIILIAGKGHETYQEIKGIKSHFDDMEEVTQFLN